MKRNRVFAVLAVLTVFLSACGINSIPRAEEEAKAKWADVQAAYQRRADLIPNLVDAVRAAATRSATCRPAMRGARRRRPASRSPPDQLTDPAAMQRFAAAQQGVSAFISARLQEALPSNETSAELARVQAQLEGTENRITIAIRDYNEAVQAYNTRIRTFPGGDRRAGHLRLAADGAVPGDGRRQCRAQRQFREHPVI